MALWSSFSNNKKQVVKVELNRKKLNSVTVKFRYSIRVTNEGDIAGYATLAERACEVVETPRVILEAEKKLCHQAKIDELKKRVDAVKTLIDEYRDPPTEDKTFRHALSIVAYELEQALKGGLDE